MVSKRTFAGPFHNLPRRLSAAVRWLGRGTSFRAWLTALLAALLAVPVAAEGPLLVVLDGSGSMWGRVAGEMKIVAAKRVVDELLEEMPPGVDLGLVAYGHRRKGDCSDIETLARPGADASTLRAVAQALSPRGKTPITAALRHAAEDLGDGPATIVLVSDGLETCGGDPCALAAELAGRGIELVIHTVGLDVGTEAATQLTCIADQGGGRYFPAANAAELQEALFAVRDSAAGGELPEAPRAAAAPTETTAETGRLRIAGPGTITLAPAPWVKMPPYRWKVHDAETGEGRGESTGPSLRIAAGEYQIVWRQWEHASSDVPLTEVVTVRSRETTEVPVDTGLRLVLPDGWKPPYRWSLLEADSDEVVARFDRDLEPQVVPAGTYRLVWRQVEHGAQDTHLGTVRIEPGRLNDRIVDSGVELQLPEWLPDGQPYYWSIRGGDGKEHGKWLVRGPQLAPAGEYTLIWRQSEHGHQEIPWGPVTIPQHGFAQLPVDSGVKFVPLGETERPYKVYFIDLESGEERVWNGKWGPAWAPVVVPPGRYRLDWWENEHGSKRMTLIDDFEVPAGTLVEIEL